MNIDLISKIVDYGILFALQSLKYLEYAISERVRGSEKSFWLYVLP